MKTWKRSLGRRQRESLGEASSRGWLSCCSPEGEKGLAVQDLVPRQEASQAEGKENAEALRQKLGSFKALKEKYSLPCTPSCHLFSSSFASARVPVTSLKPVLVRLPGVSYFIQWAIASPTPFALL